MKKITAQQIKKAVTDLSIQANLVLRKDVFSRLREAFSRETNPRAVNILKAVIRNADIAVKEHLAICQDTGMPCVFIELGQGIKIEGDLNKAVNQGIEAGYKKGFLRNSIIKNPLLRGKPGYAPALIHYDIVKGNKLKITVFPKGFGCENKTQLRMFNPTVNIEQVKKFIVDTVKCAGPDACPPYIVGVGIGGTADYACLLAKKALLRKLKTQYAQRVHTCQSDMARCARRNTKIAKLEAGLLRTINKLNIGPMGLGGKNTALAVNIETYPTHIAGLPVAVNISCHALRSATAVL